MVRTICGSGDGIEVVEGAAGAGKTFALAAARQAWEASGYRVIGCALAARAARQLQDDAGIPAATINRLLGDLADHDRPGVDSSTIIVVDEAAMVGTRKLARLLGYAEAAQAKVVLVGDPCQLPEIDAGGAFRGLATAPRRQPADRQPSPDPRVGAPGAGGAARRGPRPTRSTPTSSTNASTRLRPATSARELLVEHWLNARADGEDALMVAARLADVDDLNRRARSALHAQGRLGRRPCCAGRPCLRRGDVVLALRNDYRLGVLNGTRAIVDRVDTERRTPRRRHGPRADRDPVHVRRGRSPDPWLRHHDPQGPGRHGRPMLRARRRDRVSGARLHGSLSWAPRQRSLRRRSRPPGGGAPRSGGAAAIPSISCGPQSSAAARSVSPSTNSKPCSTSQLDRLRHERDLLHARLGHRPPDPSRETGPLADQRRREQQQRDGALWHRSLAERELDRLGPIGRRTRPARRREHRKPHRSLRRRDRPPRRQARQARPATRSLRSDSHEAQRMGAPARS